MKRCILLLILLLAGCTGGPPAISPNDPPPHDIPGLVSLLAAAGLDPVAMDDISLVLRDGSLMVLVFLEDDGESLQAVLPYRGSRHGDRERMDRWNASRRFGRAYIDEDGGPVLASDLLLVPGVGRGAVVSWATIVMDMAAAFRQEAWPSSMPPVEPVNE